MVATDGKRQVISTSNAETPITGDAWPLLTCHVWEDAHCLDDENLRADFSKMFVDHLINREVVAERLDTEAAPARGFHAGVGFCLARDRPCEEIVTRLQEQRIKDSPEPDAAVPITRDYQARLYEHCGCRPIRMS